MTQKEIASVFGVSIMTVSRVLSGKEGNKVSPELAAKIRETARKGNYRENRLAKAMRTGVVPLSALCLNHSSPGRGMGTYWFDIVSHHTAILSDHQQEVLLVPFSDMEEFARRLDSLHRANLISSVVANILPGRGQEEVRILQDLGLPFVLLGKVEDPDVPHVYVDNSFVADFLLELLYEKGARSMGYYNPGTTGLPSPEQIRDENCFFHVDTVLDKRKLHCRTGIREDRIHVVTHNEDLLNGNGGFLVNNHTQERCENVWKLLKMQMDFISPDRSLCNIPIRKEDISYISPIEKLQ